MAQQRVVRYTDDLDGSDASGSVDFGLDGRDYEIDLNDEHAAKLRDALAPFIAAARRADSGRSGRRSSSTSAPRSSSGRSREETQEIRNWLKINGYQVSARGRISAEFMQAWETKTPAPADAV